MSAEAAQNDAPLGAPAAHGDPQLAAPVTPGDTPLTNRAVLTDALLTTHATPASWPIALATFLLRGGIFVLALPIVVLPSPVGLGNALLPTLMEVVFQGVSIGIAAVLGLGVLTFVAWVVGGGLLAARLEIEATRMVAANRLPPRGLAVPVGSAGSGRSPEVRAGRVLAARLIAHAPTALAMALGSARLGAVTYRELTTPVDVSTPIGVRVVMGAPEVIIVVAVCWTLGEICGSLATRRLAGGSAGVGTSLRESIALVMTRPGAILVSFVVPLLCLLVAAVPAALASAATWTVVRVALREPQNALWGVAAVVAFVVLWLIGLALIAVISAWRATVWTLAEPAVRRKSVGSRVPQAG
jgi:hypothetical protein